MVLYLLHFGALRQELVEMTAPARRIVALSKIANRCPVENGLDPATKARGGFGLGLPNGLKRSGDKRNVN